MPRQALKGVTGARITKREQMMITTIACGTTKGLTVRKRNDCWTKQKAANAKAQFEMRDVCTSTRLVTWVIAIRSIYTKSSHVRGGQVRACFLRPAGRPVSIAKAGPACKLLYIYRQCIHRMHSPSRLRELG